MLNEDNNEFYDFGGFRLDVRNRLLWRGTQQIGLALKEFEVLFFLVENAGRVVEKAELLEAVWKNTFIEEGTLTQNISRLRKKLEAAASEAKNTEAKNTEAKIIETLPKRGYRFLPAVTRRQITAPAALSVIVEEHAIQRISIEQTVFLPDDSLNVNRGGILRAEQKALVAAPENPKSKIQNPKLILLCIAVAIVFVAALFLWRNNAPLKSLVAANVVPFSGAAGREDTPAFSPDGRQLVYTWDGDEGGATDVYVRLTRSGEPVRLTDTAAVNEQYPVFSPDGSTVAFVRDFKTYGEVYLIPALGGTERLICRLFSGNYSISFSPDGKSIAVIDTADSTDKKQYAVYFINLETGMRRRLTAPAEFRGETTPRFAPDGKSIAFVRVFDNKQQDLFVVQVAAAEQNALPTEPQQITFDQKIIHSLSWSADGAAIFFVSFRGSNRAGLWRVAANGGEPETVLTGGKDITNLTVSADGKTIAFVENAPRNLDIWQIAAGNEPKPQKFLVATFNDFHPTFAPDNSRIVFTSNRSGKNELWAVDRAGKNLRQLAKTEINVGRAAVSPNGTRAAFEAGDNFAAGIFTIEIETGATRQIIAPNGSLNLLPAWSGDGRWIYFTSNRTGAEQIWKIASDSDSEPVQVTRQGGYQALPAPDGTLFFSKSRSKVDFWQIPADGSGEDERSVPEIASPAGAAVSWTANRAGIYLFFKESEDFYEARFYDFAARQIKTASDKFLLSNQILTSPAVSMDGKQILFATDNANAGSIMLAMLEQ